jgi:hypothetical protein
MVDRVVLRQVCGGPSGAVTSLWWTDCYWDIFMVDRVVLGHVYCGPSDAVTRLWWTKWH